jgi:hypothetical protein
MLVQGVLEYDLEVGKIRELVFSSGKAEVELELRLCLLFNAKDIKAITEKEVKEFKKNNTRRKE